MPTVTAVGGVYTNDMGRFRSSAERQSNPFIGDEISSGGFSNYFNMYASDNGLCNKLGPSTKRLQSRTSCLLKIQVFFHLLLTLMQLEEDILILHPSVRMLTSVSILMSIS